MRFRDRAEAGKLLAETLEEFRDSDSVVYALPRGGVVVGVEIAEYLNIPLDLVIPRKVGHPNYEEYAICAVSEEGDPVCNPNEVKLMDEEWLNNAIEIQRVEAKRRRELYLAGRPKIDVKGKIAIITDDGIATGLTMMAAINQVRVKQPLKIVVAIPVAPMNVITKLKQEYEVEVIAIDSGKNYLGAVGAYYNNFKQVTDEEVVAILDSVEGIR